MSLIARDLIHEALLIYEDAFWAAEAQARSACEILGLDPLYVAKEGGAKALATLRAFTSSAKISMIGKVTSRLSGNVLAKNAIGTSRMLDMLSGEQLPRIC